MFVSAQMIIERKRGMLKRFLILFSLLLALAGIAFAEDAIAPGRYAAVMEQVARDAGLSIQNQAIIEWSNLPLLDAPTNDALKSLMKALTVRTRQQSLDGNGFWSMNLLLQGDSVVDFSMQAKDGVYYEQSNLLGGNTVAFTPEEF